MKHYINTVNKIQATINITPKTMPIQQDGPVPFNYNSFKRPMSVDGLTAWDFKLLIKCLEKTKHTRSGKFNPTISKTLTEEFKKYYKSIVDHQIRHIHPANSGYETHLELTRNDIITLINRINTYYNMLMKQVGQVISAPKNITHTYELRPFMNTLAPVHRKETIRLHTIRLTLLDTMRKQTEFIFYRNAHARSIIPMRFYETIYNNE